MRQKKIKQATIENIQALGVITQITPLSLPKKPIALEIGSGKGQFITTLASKYPEIEFVALEKDINVSYRLAEKQQALQLPNLHIICGDAKDLNIYFEHIKVDTLYLNFSDPWPKTKHHKRRLTYETFLKLYMTILSKQGMLQFRTDHSPLFTDSLEYFKPYLKAVSVIYDLPESDVMTEYEVKKRLLGPIYQYQGVKHETI